MTNNQNNQKTPKETSSEAETGSEVKTDFYKNLVAQGDFQQLVLANSLAENKDKKSGIEKDFHDSIKGYINEIALFPKSPLLKTLSELLDYKDSSVSYPIFYSVIKRFNDIFTGVNINEEEISKLTLFHGNYWNYYLNDWYKKKYETEPQKIGFLDEVRTLLRPVDNRYSSYGRDRDKFFPIGSIGFVIKRYDQFFMVDFKYEIEKEITDSNLISPHTPSKAINSSANFSKGIYLEDELELVPPNVLKREQIEKEIERLRKKLKNEK
jgi:hypothetical protein